MVRRFAGFVATLLLVLAAQVPVAHAWGNGGYDGDGYGTHDWILEQAVSLAGAEGQWVDLDVALRATDDPDYDGSDPGLHGFKESGWFRGAPFAVSELHRQAVEAYKAGDTRLASQLLGRLSHYYTDILNPFHSAIAASGRTTVHFEYEMAVNDYTNRPGMNSGWVSARAAIPVVDVREKTANAGVLARGYFPALIAGADSGGWLRMSSDSVRAITIKMLSRGANDLADIVRSIPVGVGVAPTPASVHADMSTHTPSRGGNPTVSATVRDAHGVPLQGVSVTFTLYMPSGPVTDLRYSDSHGVARTYHRVVSADAGHTIRVVAVAEAGGKSATSTTTFTPRVSIGSGTGGLKTSVSNSHPAQGSVVAVTAIVRDTSGNPMAGLKVTFSWKFRTKTVTVDAVTDSTGVARCSRNIYASSRGFRVIVSARVVVAARFASTSFVPR